VYVVAIANDAAIDELTLGCFKLLLQLSCDPLRIKAGLTAKRRRPVRWVTASSIFVQVFDEQEAVVAAWV
jgi:hypothetical protein